jgi:hypothetical protein
MLDLKEISTNKYFFGVIMIIINFGSRFIIEELTPNQINFLRSNQIVRRIIIFSIFFMATRDILASCILTIIFIILITSVFKDENNGEKYPKEKIINDVNIQLEEIKKNLHKLNDDDDEEVINDNYALQIN